jgi:DNA-binding GntR family transcriptional regulator
VAVARTGRGVGRHEPTVVHPDDPEAAAVSTITQSFGQTITTTLANLLRTEIRNGVLPPGTRLRQNDVAKQYSVSTTPVREAFMMLEREGLLTRSDHKGAVVFAPTADDLREIYLIRLPLEILATEHGVPNLTAADLDEMEAALKTIRRAHRDNDVEAARAANDEFHSTIYRAAGLPRLLILISQLRSASTAYINLYRTFEPAYKDSEREHLAILEACRARAPKKAAAAVRQHLMHTVEVVGTGLGTASR